MVTDILSFYFCANPDCELHFIPSGMAQHGMPNWVRTQSTGITSRLIVDNHFYCDHCARQRIRLSFNSNQGASL